MNTSLTKYNDFSNHARRALHWISVSLVRMSSWVKQVGQC